MVAYATRGRFHRKYSLMRPLHSEQFLQYAMMNESGMPIAASMRLRVLR
eukprot:gene26666-49094_t